MKTILKTLFTVILFSYSSVVYARDSHDHVTMAPVSVELNQIKSLEGRWFTVTDMFGKKNERVYTEYKVISAGSAVLERFAPGTPYEMVSVYYDDNRGKLAMTHYCMMKNRPSLKLKSSTADTLNLRVTKVDGLKSRNEPSMGDLTFHFKDKNHYEITCSARGKGDHNKPMTATYTRVK